MIAKLKDPRWLMALLAVACVGLTGCQNDASDITNPTEYDKIIGQQPAVISGLVKDTEGHPVADASIILTYELPAGVATTSDKVGTMLQITLESPAFGKIWIGDRCRDAMVRVLHEGPLDAGVHCFQWDGMDNDSLYVLDGIYRAHMDIQGQPTSFEFFLAHDVIDDDASPDDYRRLATTGVDGRFVFDDACLDFDQVVRYPDENNKPQDSFTVSRNVRIWALHEDHPTGSTPDLLYVSPFDGLEVEITMPD